MSEGERNLVITGMMGTGKTSVGRLIAQRLARTLVDTDDEIQKRFGKKIANIFQEEGECAFRKAEQELCQELSEQNGLVISTGGGFLVPRASQELMRKHSVFCLDARPETLLDRLKNSRKRPLIIGPSEGNLHRIQKIMDERRDSYQRIFHHVETDHRQIAEVADEIVSRFQIDCRAESESIRFVRMPLQPSYPILVKEGAAFEIALYLKWAGVKASRVLIMTNAKLKELYGDKIEKGLTCEWLLIPDGELNKNLETVQSLYKNLLTLNARRDDIIIAFGGGVVGDIAGFAAATFMRGLRFIQIPTTLLAMVDSSIGGKTGVDLDEGKNLIGAFKQPLMVLADPLLLATLPEEEFRSGMAEVIKHALINDPSLFDALFKDAKIKETELVFRALEVKADIVEEDPFEQGRRALLNLGHTFGHAIEKVSSYGIRHGYAVAVGLVAACELAHRLQRSESGLRAKVESVLQRFQLPIKISGMTAGQIVSAMQHDKKGGAHGLRFVVSHDIGDVRLASGIDEMMLRDVIETVLF